VPRQHDAALFFFASTNTNPSSLIAGPKQQGQQEEATRITGRSNKDNRKKQQGQQEEATRTTGRSNKDNREKLQG
jgi:hypothetical protein